MRYAKPDINILVNSILQIAPHYKSKDQCIKGKDKKREKPKEVFHRDKPVKKVKTEEKLETQDKHNDVYSKQKEVTKVGLNL